MSKHPGRQKWHQQKRWILGSLLFFPPLGISLLWLTRWPRASKISGSIFSGLLLLAALTSEATEPTTTVPPEKVTEAAPQAEVAPSPAYEDAITEATAASTELTIAESSVDWANVARRWQNAIASLSDIPISRDDYSQAQTKIAEYERNYDYAISKKTVARSAEDVTAAKQQVEEQQQAVVAQEAETVMPIVEEQGGGYVDGTCKDLAASGVGSDFRPGDANYTSARDRDGDGVACES